jgi:hypothetical protein
MQMETPDTPPVPISPQMAGCQQEPCCASSAVDAVKSWGPLVIADVIGGDLAENTVTLRIHGPMPRTLLGAQWFLFHDAPPAADRLPFPSTLEDSLRLDWLDAHKKEMIEHKPDGATRRVLMIRDMEINDDQKGDSIRDLIDCAASRHNVESIHPESKL